MPSPPPKLVEKLRVTFTIPAIAAGATAEAASPVAGILEGDGIVANPATTPSILMVSLPRFLASASVSLRFFNPGPVDFAGADVPFDVTLIRG
jgi:hypothetical protein